MSDLNALLEQMSRYGKPRLTYSVTTVGTTRVGWSCWIELFTPAVGVCFEIKSEFWLPTPMAAAEQCWARVREAMTVSASKAKELLELPLP